MTAHRQKMARIGGIIFELLPEQADVHINCARHCFLIISPYFAQQLAAGENRVALLDKVAKQLELARRKFNALAVATDFDLPKINFDAAELKNLAELERKQCAAAQERFDACEQLHRLIRFGQVIIGAELEAEHFVNHLAARSEH